MVNDDGNGTVGAGTTVTGGVAAGGSDMRTGVGVAVPEGRTPGTPATGAGAVAGGAGVAAMGTASAGVAGAGGGTAAASAVGAGAGAAAMNTVGTAVLLAAAPAGRGRAMDAASVLPALAAVPPGVLTGTAAATVVELADPLDPQTVLTRLRAAAASPGPLVVCLAGQLHLDRRQQLPHLALARTTPATLRYTALPWHWLAGELGARQPGTTTVVADLAADPDVWQRLTAAPGLLHPGPGTLLYGRVVPAPRKGEPTTPEYLRAWAELWRSGARLTPAAAHAEAAARARTVAPAPEPVFLAPPAARAPGPGPASTPGSAPVPVPVPAPATVPGSAPVPAPATRPAPAPESASGAAYVPRPTPGPVSTPVPAARPVPLPAIPPAFVPATPPVPAPTSGPAPVVDPHPAILAAAMAGRHGEAAAVAAAWEHEALRRHGPRSMEAVHWTEVRADLARLSGEPARSCELWLAAAEARLGLGQRPDDPDVEGAVDRAHHQWEQIGDRDRARALGPTLVGLRRRVPGRRPGALAALTRRMG
ncbi:hypothetical protein [Streptomyces vietnamensis]|uniref:hypothetical protein n=1 Tax=Streptomyces vietnamensis TaxID=362257 RepID=UPI003F4CE8D6